MTTDIHGAEAFAYSGTELDAMSEAKHYYRWIIRQFAPFAGQNVLEVGAGAGTFASHLVAALPDGNRRFTLLEPAENLFPELEERFRAQANVTALHGDLQMHAGNLKVDTAILVNVLEHVEDDAACLSLLHSILEPGGYLLVFVPAVPALYGSLDAAFDHFRRYTRGDLSRKLRQAGFEIKKMRFMNLPGVGAWFFQGKILRRRTLRSSAVRFYDRWVIRPWSRCEDIWEPPIGQNLLAVARK